MSHRTTRLPPLEGLPRIVRELRYHEASRQILGLLSSIVFALTADPQADLLYAATPPVLAGVGIRMWASGVITKNRELATSGPYRYVRHPLYVGNILIIAAFVLASGNWWTAPVALTFLLFYYPTAIEYEERKLGSIFGAAWNEYTRTTRALLPSLSARPQGDGVTWSLRKSVALNLEPLVAVFILALFAYVFTRLMINTADVRRVVAESKRPEAHGHQGELHPCEVDGHRIFVKVATGNHAFSMRPALETPE